MRKSRSSGLIIYAYTYNGSKLTQMTKGTDTLYFTYDAFGAPWTVNWNGTVYTYVTNLQGDVIAIVNYNNRVVVEYTYDAWGNVLMISGSMGPTLGMLNPLTYRGYVYDYETGLYYLQSRYYNPEWGRFLNADALVSTGGLLGNNMFAYCGNNPVSRIDPTGKSWAEVKELLTGIVRRIIGSIRDMITNSEDTYLNQSQRQHNATIVYRYLKNQGWSHNAICATLGNMEQESTINPGLHQRNGNAFGIVQWDPPTKFTTWADSNGYAYDSITGQLEFLIYSMQPGREQWFDRSSAPGFYLSANEFMCSNESIDYLTAVFLHSYERAGDPQLEKRVAYAQYWSDYFSK